MDQVKYTKIKKRLLYKMQAQISLRNFDRIRKIGGRICRLKKKYSQASQPPGA